MKIWDCIIVGAGPAGLSAAVYMGRFRRSTLVFDCGDGRWSYGQANDNYLGFPGGVRARRLHALGRAQAERFGVAFKDALVTRIEADGAGTGCTMAGARPPPAPSSGRQACATAGRTSRASAAWWGSGSSGASSATAGAHASAASSLLGNTEKDVGTALQFVTYTRELTFVSDRPSQRALPPQAGGGGDRLPRGRVKRVATGEEASSAWSSPTAPSSGPTTSSASTAASRARRCCAALAVALTRSGYVRIDDKNRTNLATFFAAGDVSDRHAHQVVAAVHEGAAAAMSANHVLYPALQRL